MPSDGGLTERQAKWFAAVRAGLEQRTGRTIAEWAEIARCCPERAHRKRLAWLKAAHGLGQNHASLILAAAFPRDAGWSDPEQLAERLWCDPESKRLFDAVRAAATALPEVVTGQRRAFTAFSRRVQFAAARPTQGGGLALGLALAPESVAGGLARGRESWSERLTATLVIDRTTAADATLASLLRAAWERS